MQASPCPSSTRGLTSRGTLLLVLTGAGLASFLFVVLPRLSESRAGGSSRLPAEVPPEDASPTGPPPSVELVQLRSGEPEEPAPPPPSVAGAIQTFAPPVEVAEAKVEGPKMKYLKGSGQSKEVDRRDPRISNREQRKQRRERAAQGIAPESTGEKYKNTPGPGKRLSNRSGKGRAGPGKEKPKDG